MAASQATVVAIVAELRGWQNDFAISDSAVRMLLSRIASVEGNKSFAETIRRIATEYQGR